MNSQKMIRLSVIAALAGVYGSAFAGTAYDKGTNFIDQTYENVVGTQPSEHKGAVMAFYPTNADDVFNIRNCVFNNNTSPPMAMPSTGLRAAHSSSMAARSMLKTRHSRRILPARAAPFLNSCLHRAPTMF